MSCTISVIKNVSSRCEERKASKNYRMNNTHNQVDYKQQLADQSADVLPLSHIHS